MSSDKSRGFTYFFALIGGIFGLHHIYLGRTQHALLWLTTFGGFGVGIFYEIFFQLNKYVREVNYDDLIIQQYEKKIQERKSPAFELKRFICK
jgi:DnaJ family protein C protein 22